MPRVEAHCARHIGRCSRCVVAAGSPRLARHRAFACHPHCHASGVEGRRAVGLYVGRARESSTVGGGLVSAQLGRRGDPKVSSGGFLRTSRVPG